MFKWIKSVFGLGTDLESEANVERIKQLVEEKLHELIIQQQEIEDFEAAQEQAKEVRAALEGIKEEAAKPEIQANTHVKYFTTSDDPKNPIYLDVWAGNYSPENIQDLARIIASNFSIEVQKRTISAVKNKLLSLERHDLLELFTEEFVAALGRNSSSSIPTPETEGEKKDKPCVSPLEMLK